MGNRATHTWGGLVDTYSTQTASNRLMSISGPRAKAFTTNVNGQITANAGATYTYNGFNRLVGATKAGVTATYTVNAQGQRTRKMIGSANTRFVYAGQNQLLAENAAAAWSNYLWFNGELMGIVRGGQLYYSHNDQLGRPEVVTNSAKTVVWRANNYAYDRTVTVNSFGGLNLGFPGQYYDSESGLRNNGFRDYDASLGRYMQSDPIGLVGGINTYTYAMENPTGFIDPLGLTAEDIACLWKYAVQTEVDLDFPETYDVRDLGVSKDGFTIAGRTNPATGAIAIDDRYLADLTPGQLVDLYDTIVHEGLHRNHRLRRESKIGNEANERSAAQAEAIKSGGTGCGCE